MPELPEVESFRKYFEGTSLNHTITKIEVESPKLVKPGVDAFKQAVLGLSFTGSDRIGKYLFPLLSNDKAMVMHFGLTGKLEYFRDMEDLPRFTRVLFHFDNDFKLAYICMRKFGWVDLTESVASYKEKVKLGDDALKLTFDTFYTKIRKKKTLIKPTLLDQKITAGIGNWIADEILYQSKIHPETRVDNLSEKDFKTLYDKIKHIMASAVENDADQSSLPEDFMIHNRVEGGKCHHTGGDIIRIEVGGRGTFFSPKRQKIR